MGVTKQYLRVAPGPTFGLVASQKSNIVCIPDATGKATLCAVGACEDVYIWDVIKKEKALVLPGDKSEVSSLAKSPASNHLAVGYFDGAIKIFDLDTSENTVTFHGHKSAVTTLAYDAKGLRLVSGAKDKDVILWDIVSEAGMYRLRGHKKEITKAIFMKNRDILVTSSKDSFIKFWDLNTQHCFFTVIGHRAEVYGFVLLRDETRLVSCSVDSELRVWDIEYLESQGEEEGEADMDTSPPVKRARFDEVAKDHSSEEEKEDSDDDRTEEEKANDEAKRILTCTKVGSVMRQGRERCVTLCTDPQEKLLFVHGTDKHLEVFELLSKEDLNKVRAKRVKKLRKKHLDSGEDVDTTSVTVKLQDEIRAVDRFRFDSKLWSIHTCMDRQQLRVCALLTDNRLDSALLTLDKHKAELTAVTSVTQAGHRNEARTLCVSADNGTILSASAGQVKLWNRDSLQCVRTMQCEYALCSMFVTGGQHAIIGTKTGKLQLYEINQGILLETVEAHTGAVWSIDASPDKRGIISGGADKEVRFWNYELQTNPDTSKQNKVLTLEHTKTLKMDDDVLCLKYTPNHKILAIAVLDNTVKILFADTLKFFLSLYGHKLPVVCMDISSDSTLIVTGSADRNIKIWGLDFGDCHRSLFAHDESVTCLKFVPRTHLFFSGGKDRKVKQWDADNFENIISLSGHHAEVRSLAVSPSGNTVVTSSHDRSLRLWEKTEEPLVLEEEREMQREEEEEDEALAREGEEVVPGETTEEVKMAGKKTIQTVKGTERIMEALEIFQTQMALIEENVGKKPPTPHPMMLAYRCDTPQDFVLETLKRIRASELQGALLSLPFSYVPRLLPVLDHCLDTHRETELVCKCLNFLLKIHHGEITANPSHLHIVEKLKGHWAQAVTHHRDMAAFNLAGLSFLKKHIEEANQVMLFADATTKRKKKKKKAMLTVK